jgi:hypothetical protein
MFSASAGTAREFRRPSARLPLKGPDGVSGRKAVDAGSGTLNPARRAFLATGPLQPDRREKGIDSTGLEARLGRGRLGEERAARGKERARARGESAGREGRARRGDAVRGRGAAG